MMDEIVFKHFSPNLLESFNLLNSEPTIKKYVYFSVPESSLLYYNNELAGGVKVDILNDEVEDNNISAEIFIGILPQFRKKGIARKALSKILQNIFSQGIADNVVVQIDKDNGVSIGLFASLGFELCQAKQDELESTGDFNTQYLVLTKEKYYSKYISTSNKL